MCTSDKQVSVEYDGSSHTLTTCRNKEAKAGDAFKAHETSLHAVPQLTWSQGPISVQGRLILAAYP